MNVIAHLTYQDIPIWIAMLIAGVGVGITISVAIIGIVRRKS